MLDDDTKVPYTAGEYECNLDFHLYCIEVGAGAGPNRYPRRAPLRKRVFAHPGPFNGDLLAEAGFVRVRIDPKEESREFIREWAPGRRPEDYVCAALIAAVKPAAAA